MRASATALCLAFGILAFFGGSASARQFSADLVATNARGLPTGAGKIYVGDGVVRIEAPDVQNGRFVINVVADTAFFVMPAQRLFMDAKQSSRLSQVLVPVDPNDPCRAWQRMAQIAGAADHGGRWSCERLHPDVLGGRTVLEYGATSPRGEADYAWIDQELEFPVSFQFADGMGIKLGNIREGSQPAALFAIPADYRKFDPRQLIERIKHSDVWVDPPK
jgi:hypothetical protein